MYCTTHKINLAVQYTRAYEMIVRIHYAFPISKLLNCIPTVVIVTKLVLPNWS